MAAVVNGLLATIALTSSELYMWTDFCTCPCAIKFCLPSHVYSWHHTHDKMYQVLSLLSGESLVTRLCWRGDGQASGDGWSTRHSEGNSAPTTVTRWHQSVSSLLTHCMLMSASIVPWPWLHMKPILLGKLNHLSWSPFVFAIALVVSAQSFWVGCLSQACFWTVCPLSTHGLISAYAYFQNCKEICA